MSGELNVNQGVKVQGSSLPEIVKEKVESFGRLAGSGASKFSLSLVGGAKAVAEKVMSFVRGGGSGVTPDQALKNLQANDKVATNFWSPVLPGMWQEVKTAAKAGVKSQNADRVSLAASRAGTVSSRASISGQDSISGIEFKVPDEPARASGRGRSSSAPAPAGAPLEGAGDVIPRSISEGAVPSASRSPGSLSLKMEGQVRGAARQIQHRMDAAAASKVLQECADEGKRPQLVDGRLVAVDTGGLGIGLGTSTKTVAALNHMLDVFNGLPAEKLTSSLLDKFENLPQVREQSGLFREKLQLLRARAAPDSQPKSAAQSIEDVAERIVHGDSATAYSAAMAIGALADPGELFSAIANGWNNSSSLEGSLNRGNNALNFATDFLELGVSLPVDRNEREVLASRLQDLCDSLEEKGHDVSQLRALIMEKLGESPADVAGVVEVSTPPSEISLERSAFEARMAFQANDAAALKHLFGSLLADDFAAIPVSVFDKDPTKDVAVKNYIADFNGVVHFCRLALADSRSVAELEQGIEKLVNVGEAASKEGNFALAAAVRSALGDFERDIPANTPAARGYASLKDLTNTTANNQSLKIAYGDAMREGKPVIPQFSLYFSDVEFTKDGKTKDSINEQKLNTVAQVKGEIRYFQEKVPEQLGGTTGRSLLDGALGLSDDKVGNYTAAEKKRIRATASGG